jgi:hypothetical protein
MNKYTRIITKPSSILLVLIFLFGLFLRLESVLPFQTIIGFDQARDLFAAREIINGDLKIIGPTAGNNPNLHHGVVFLYYLAIPLFLFGSSPMSAVLFNVFVNSLIVFVLYFFARSLFSNKTASMVAAVLAATSYYHIQYSGWLSNPTLGPLLSPLFFWSFWVYLKGRNNALILAAFMLGLCIQFELFFIYLIPVSIALIIIFRKGIPFRIGLLSVASFSLASLTMIATEIKYGFAGIAAILGAGNYVGEGVPFLTRISHYIPRFVQTASLTILPSGLRYASLFVIILLLFGALVAFRNRKNDRVQKQFIFLIAYLFSPAVMLFLGEHNAPWFLIGKPGATILLVSFIVANLKRRTALLVIIAIVVLLNTQFVFGHNNDGQVLLGPDRAARMQNQIAAIDYTYQSSGGKPFAISTVTNPLYINIVWAYQYNWYGKKYGYFPSWSGGDQLPPYNTLPKWTEDEEYLYLLIDMTPRIPEVHRNAALTWANSRSELLESKYFDGIIVEKRRLTN